MDSAATPNTHAAPDAALVQRARGGDQEAFTALIDARLPTTYRTALAFLGNEPDARDATEEIFVRAWRDLPELPEPDGFGPWFAQIVEETCRTAASGPRRAIVRDVSPGTSAAATSGTLRRQILDRVATTPQRSGPRPAQTASNPIRTSRRARFGIGIPVIALLVIALVALIGQRLQTPETPFRSGLVAFVRDGDVYLANPDGTAPTLVVHQDGLALATVAWSPDGRRVAIDGDSGAIVFDTTTGTTTYVGGSGPAWSPDGRQIAVIDFGNESAVLRLHDLESGAATTHPFNGSGDMAWSPDGRWIAASGTSGGRFGNGDSVLVRIEVSTGQVLTLDPSTRVRGPARRPTWSPDSFRIAFSRAATDGYQCGGTLLCDSDVFTADPDGTGVVQLNDPKTSADQPTWSPDGKWVAFRQIAQTSTSLQDTIEDPDANVGLVVVSPDLTATRTLDARDVHAFAWSPEGDRIRYVRSEGRGHPATLWEVSLDDEAHPAKPLGILVDPAARYDARPGSGVAWQSLGRAAAMPGVPSAAPPAAAPVTAIATPAPAPPADPSASWPSLAIESIDGCQPPRLVATADGSERPIGKPCDGTGGDMQYGWSPTGTQHAALSSDGRLSITGLDGVEHQNVGDLSAVGSFSWSPGGSWLSVSGSSDRILRPDGSGLRDLPGSPTWSPDERRMSISWPEGTLLVGDGDGTGLRAVGSFPPYVVWSQDGSRFAFIRDGDVWTAAADGTDIRNVTAFPLGGASNMAWSPDDRWLAVATTHGAWVMRPDGTDRRGLVFGPSKAMGGLVWAPDTSRLAVEAYSDDTTGQDITIYLLAVDGSAAVRVDAASGPSWSPDGRYLAVGHVTPSSGGGYEIGNLAVMNGNGSGRRDLPVTTNGNWPIWVHPDR